MDTGTIEQWFAEPLGQFIAKMEKKRLAKVLPNLLGYHLLQLGCVNQMSWVDASPIPHKIFMSCNVFDDLPQQACLAADPMALPFQKESIDVILAPHVLESSTNPEILLKELKRVLVPEGVIIFLHFNALSLWSIIHKLKHFYRWCTPPPTYMSSYRLRSLLQQLDLDIIYTDSFCYRPCLKDLRRMQQLDWLETLGHFVWLYPGAINLVMVKRREITLTPVLQPKFAKLLTPAISAETLRG